MSTLYNGKVRIPSEVIERFRRRHPHFGEFNRIMLELLTKYLDEKDKLEAKGESNDNS